MNRLEWKEWYRQERLIAKPEIWKDIEGYEGRYQISSKGRVKSLKFNNTNIEKVMRMRNNKGYRSILFKSPPNYYKYFLVHRLVGQAFLGLDINDKYMLVCHKNDKKNDNRKENLFLGSHKDNSIDMVNKGRQNIVNKRKVGMYNALGKIRQFDSLNDAEKYIGVSRVSISKVCNGKRRTSGGFIWKYE